MTLNSFLLSNVGSLIKLNPPRLQSALGHSWVDTHVSFSHFQLYLLINGLALQQTSLEMSSFISSSTTKSKFLTIYSKYSKFSNFLNVFCYSPAWDLFLGWNKAVSWLGASCCFQPHKQLNLSTFPTSRTLSIHHTDPSLSVKGRTESPLQREAKFQN